MAAEVRSVMLAHARSGSTLLMEFLDAQPGMSFAHEIFHQEKVHLPTFMDRPGDPAALKAMRDADPLGFLERVAAACPTPVFGFKWFRGHSPAVRDHVIADPSWRVLILYRENFLALFASQRTARLTGRYIARAAGAAAPLPMLPFDADAFLREYALYRRYYEGLLAQCDRAGKPFHLVEYQHLSHPALLRNAARAIGIAAPVAAAPTMVKQGSTRLIGRFEDPALVQRTLEGINRLHWLVEEDHFFAGEG
jgi:LPS sulfotransferase NodH